MDGDLPTRAARPRVECGLQVDLLEAGQVARHDRRLPPLLAEVVADEGHDLVARVVVEPVGVHPLQEGAEAMGELPSLALRRTCHVASP